MASIFKFFEERFKEVLDPSRKKYIVGEHLRGPVPDSQESQVKVENVDSTNTQTPTDEATNIDSNTDAQTPKAEL